MAQSCSEPANDNQPIAVRNGSGMRLQAFLDANVPPRLWRRVVDHFEACAGQVGCAFSIQAVATWREMKGLTPRLGSGREVRREPVTRSRSWARRSRGQTGRTGRGWPASGRSARSAPVYAGGPIRSIRQWSGPVPAHDNGPCTPGRPGDMLKMIQADHHAPISPGAALAIFLGRNTGLEKCRRIADYFETLAAELDDAFGLEAVRQWRALRGLPPGPRPWI